MQVEQKCPPCKGPLSKATMVVAQWPNFSGKVGKGLEKGWKKVGSKSVGKRLEKDWKGLTCWKRIGKDWKTVGKVLGRDNHLVNPI